MKFKATEKQVQKMAALASNASIPIGMGFLQHNPNKEFGAHDFEIRGGIFLDYVMGRMVKLRISKVKPDYWEIPDQEPTPDYQSWCGKYPTYKDLMEAAGILWEK